jgi:hypothetical protein
MPTEPELARAHLQAVLIYERLLKTSPTRAALHQLSGAVANCSAQGFTKEDVQEFVRQIYEERQIFEELSQLNGSGGDP